MMRPMDTMCSIGICRSMARASQFSALVPRSKIQVMRYLFEHVGNSSHSRQQDVSDSGNNNYMSKLSSMRKPVPFIFFSRWFQNCVVPVPVQTTILLNRIFQFPHHLHPQHPKSVPPKLCISFTLHAKEKKAFNESRRKLQR